MSKLAGTVCGIVCGKDLNANKVQLGSLLNLKPRGNVVGFSAVTPDSYVTNTKPTTYTVGASGANYTTLNAAYAAAAAGDVIEIIDDSTTLTARLNMTKGVDANGNAIKIKGKPTGTRLNLFAHSYPFYLSAAGASIEVENINFAEDTNTVSYPVWSVNTNTTGFVHLINCSFALITRTNVKIYLQNTPKIVFDRITWGNYYPECTIESTFVESGSYIKADLNVMTSPSDNHEFIKITQASTAKGFDAISITNCTTSTYDTFIDLVRTKARNIRIEGNKMQITTSAGLYLGFETGAKADWSSATAYVIGDLVFHLGILYQCLVNNSNSEPNRDINTNWKRAELITGTVKNNTFYRTTYIGSGHGLFAGFGTYDMVIENNIVTNFWYNMVVKGHDNFIRYNCIGKGSPGGLYIFANDQQEVRNNTIRATDSALSYGPNNADMQGLINTIFRDNLLFSSGSIISDYFSRWVDASAVNNQFVNNKVFGTTASFKGTTYSLPDDVAVLKTELSDSKLAYQDPEIVATDDTLPAYYTPLNTKFKKYLDQFGQSVGAIDLSAT